MSFYMTPEIEKGNEIVDICVVIIVIAAVILSVIFRVIYYTNLFGGIVILVLGGGLILICIYSMASDSKPPTPHGTSTHVSCPACGMPVTYSYKSKDAFGRVVCSYCGDAFNPSKYQGSTVSSEQQPLTLPHGNPRPLVDGCEDSKFAASIANTRLSYSVGRRSVRSFVNSLGMDKLQTLIRMGLDYLDANRIAIALACFYEAELIKFDDERLVKIRAKFNRPDCSFNDIAEEYLQGT